jgi:mono/diheme cytochrome c family protein
MPPSCCHVPDRHASRRSTALAVATLASAFLLSACDRQPGGTGVTLRTDDPQVLAQGRTLYQAQCAACHGARLEGQPDWRERDASGRLPAPPHDASGHTWHHPDQVLFDLVKYGVAKAAHLPGYDSAMPAYEGKLTDAEIVAVLAWIRSQWPPEMRKLQQQADEAARRQRKG